MARRRARRPRVRPRSPVREVCGGASFGYLRSWHLPQRRRRRYQRCLKDVSAVWRTTPEMGDLPSARQMEFLILGPLEVRSNGHSLALGGPKQRAVLALLLLGANRVVSREHLIAELWPDAPGRDSEHALRLQISRLRRALSAAGDGEDRVVTRAPGYSLRVEPGELDLERYERLVAAGRAALEARDADSAVARLREAESLWRGRPLADLEFEPFARLDVERLEERRLTALEERIEAEVAAGRHRELVPELEGLIAEHPLRERLRAQLMRALYASSRQAEALAVYTDTRRLLVDELGIEPSAPLRELERQILNQDAGLLHRRPAPPALPAPEGIREPRRTPPRLLRRALLGIPALGGVLVLVILLAGDQRPQPLRIPGPGAVLFLGAGSGDPLGQVPTGPGASRMRFGLGALWKLEDPGELLQIDPPSMWLKRTVPIGFAGDIAVAGNGVWISGDTNTLVRVDPIYGTIAQRIRLPHHGVERPRSGGGVAFGAGSVWASQGHSRVFRIDPVGERIQRVFDVPDAGVLAFGGGALWVGSSELGKLTKIDPRSNAIVASVRVGPSICCLAAGGGYVWAANDSGVWKISSDGRPIAVTELPSGRARCRMAQERCGRRPPGTSSGSTRGRAQRSAGTSATRSTASRPPADAWPCRLMCPSGRSRVRSCKARSCASLVPPCGSTSLTQRCQLCRGSGAGPPSSSSRTRRAQGCCAIAPQRRRSGGDSCRRSRRRCPPSREALEPSRSGSAQGSGSRLHRTSA